MDPMLEQFCRIYRREDLRPEWFSQFQRYLSSVVQPKLDQLEPLLLENEKLREELAAVREAVPVKRGPGRPRKVRPEDVEVGA